MKKVVLVTGGASGLGLALVKLLSAQGYSVALFDRDENQGLAAIEDMEAAFYQVDVTDWENWREAVFRMKKEQGIPEKVFLNAGVMSRPGSSSIQDDIFDWMEKGSYARVMKVNVDGALLGVRALRRPMAENGGGSIVVTSSLAGIAPLPFDPFYSMSKHAVVGMVRSFAPLLEPLRIRLNAFCPGGMATPLLPHQFDDSLKNMMTPEMAAASCIEVSEITGSGTINMRLGPNTDLEEYITPEVIIPT